MACLALAAILLLALLPTIGRWVEAGRDAPSLAGMAVLRRGNRLSITPVMPDEWRAVLALLKKPG